MPNITESKRTIENIPRPQMPLKPKHLYLPEANIPIEICFSASACKSNNSREYSINSTRLPLKRTLSKSMKFDRELAVDATSKIELKTTSVSRQTGPREFRIELHSTHVMQDRTEPNSRKTSEEMHKTASDLLIIRPE